MEEVGEEGKGMNERNKLEEGREEANLSKKKAKADEGREEKEEANCPKLEGRGGRREWID